MFWLVRVVLVNWVVRMNWLRLDFKYFSKSRQNVVKGRRSFSLRFSVRNKVVPLLRSERL